MADLSKREAVTDSGIEIDALGERAAKRIGDLMRDIRIDVATTGGELDPQIALHLIINEAANHR